MTWTWMRSNGVEPGGATPYLQYKPVEQKNSKSQPMSRNLALEARKIKY